MTAPRQIRLAIRALKAARTHLRNVYSTDARVQDEARGAALETYWKFDQLEALAARAQVALDKARATRRGK